ncbi:MAG: hypothetical protein CVV07_13530 [Gammaproteobacteria bacterium HGW-Gammaproteobacteria-11]|nr:MAG: hypothetical protein CVV07_13530 [Gammaproteobacteria bacterium HGW-Gammaproteobacteria-11]
MKTTLLSLFAGVLITTSSIVAAQTTQAPSDPSVTTLSMQKLITGNDGLERSQRFYDNRRQQNC